MRPTDLTLLIQAYGVPDAVAASLRELAKAGRQPYAVSSFSFVILRFDQDSASDVVYTETLTDADYLDRPDLVRTYTKLWDDLRAAALGPVESRLLIEQLGDPS